MVAIGRPKGHRGCYKQWEEGGIAPQVVFEVLSPSNSVKEMNDKRAFYDTYGVEEYYVYDPPPTPWRSGCARTGGCAGCRI
jgi:Uma2 family endonuclease